jgi:cytochrome c oxidase assembly factor CtaG
VDAVLASLQLFPATATGVLYALRVHALRGTTRAVPAWRQGCFYGGLVFIVATLTALGRLSDQLFAAHMAEHLLMADVGTLALVLGVTGPLLAPVLRVRAIDRLRVIAHPAVAFPLWAIDLYLWHAPALQEAAVRHSGIHALQHLSFIFFGANMWMALLGPLPKPAWFGNLARLVYVVAVRFTGAVLGNVFVFGGLFARTAREGEERQALLDLARDRGVDLSEARAARAVAAGRGAELRRRIEGTG